ncbi:MAG: hypothetical protein QW608_03575 [Thermoplasmata archaeon]
MANLAERILNAYKIEKYAEISLLALFLKEEKKCLKNISAKLILESMEHERRIKEIMEKMGINDSGKIDYEFTKKEIENKNMGEILLLMINNEIKALNAYLEILINTNRDEINHFFNNVDREFYSKIKKTVFEEFKHIKKILEFINKNEKKLINNY